MPPTAVTPQPSMPHPSTPPVETPNTAKKIDMQGIQDARMAIDLMRSNALTPRLNRDVRETKQNYQSAADQGLSTRTAGERVLEEAEALPAAPRIIQDLTQRLRARIAENKRASTERARELARLSSAIKKSFIGTIVAALYIAVASDILSIFDLGWLTSWGIVIVTYFIARRIAKINTGAEQIQRAYQKTLQSIQLTQQRIGAVFPKEEKRPVFQGLSSVLEARFGSYLKRFALETAGVQGFELIPILDWLPAYTGQVVKIVIDQHSAYQKARRFLPPLQEAFAQAEQLEALEVSLMEQRLTETLYIYYAYPLQAPEEVAPQPAPRISRNTAPSRPAPRQTTLIPEPAL